MQKSFKKKIYCWACDYSAKTGEGNLAKLFLKERIKNSKIFCPQKNYNEFSIINFKYLSPIFGILFCWYHFLKKKNVAYINYLPLWNSIIFLLLPPKTLIGPITGGANFSKGEYYYIRKFIFPILYKVSEILILIRFKNPVFSTSLLKSYLFKKTINKSTFNFVFNYVKKKKRKRKNIDFIIYYRNHKNKKNLYNLKLLKKIINLKYKVYCVGDELNIYGIENLGFLSKKKLNILLEKTKFSLCSQENIYSLFTLDCINNNVKIILDYQKKKLINKYRENFIFVNSKFSDLTKKVS